MSVSIIDTALSLKSIFDSYAEEEKLQLFTRQIKSAIIALYGVADTSTESGSSVDCHKEWSDRRCFRTVLMSLLPFTGVNVYFDELLFELPKGSLGLHGSIDSMVGVLSEHDEEDLPSNGHPVFNVNGPIFGEITGANLVEENDVSASESSLECDAANTEYFLDIKYTAQPVSKILAVSQIITKEPSVLFYANREVFRPFIYCKTEDVLLSTKETFQWNTPASRKLDLFGTLLMAVIVSLPFSRNLGKALLRLDGVHPTGFLEALNESTIYQNATLISQNKPAHHSATPNEGIPIDQKQHANDLRIKEIMRALQEE